MNVGCVKMEYAFDYADNIESRKHLLVMILTLDVVDLPADEMA